ncbi:MAG: M28 family peptidase [Planctomycetaceae bacterium]
MITLAESGCGTLFSGGVADAGNPNLNARRAKTYLERVCKIGRRISGTPGMAKQRKLMADHFEKLGAKVQYQHFDVAHPLTGRPVRMKNMIVSWHPDAKQRVLLACHYDTRPFPDRDPNPRKRTGRFVGANDGASGVALFMELAHHMKDLKPTYGVDFVFFDAEEFIFRDKGNGNTDDYFLGSKHFATEYKKHPPKHRYVYGVLVDMVGDRNLQLYMEKNSLRYAPDLTKSLWSTAAKLRVREFIHDVKHEVQDDHLPLNTIAGIPTCDIIDFDYRYWHTTQDVPSQCSGASLVKVGRVLLKWLENAPKPAE